MALKSGLSIPQSIPAGWRLVWFGAFAAAMLAAASPAAAEDAQQAIQSAVDSDQIQRDRPLAERAQQSIAEIEKQPDIQHDPPAPRAEDPVPKPIGPIDLGWLPYAILAVIGVGLAFLLLRYAGHRFTARHAASARVEPVATSRTVAPPEPERDHTFDEVDALAEAGAFTEAVHRLLLLVQERLRGRIEHGLQASLTSREILRRARLPQEAATAFATLVAAVEVSLFGMRAANAATYALCREHSRRVLTAAAA